MDIDELANAAMGLAMYDNYRRAMDNYSIAHDRNVQPPAKNYYAIINGTQTGPFSLGEMASMVSSGSVTSETYVWKEGMPDWVVVSDVPELMAEVKRKEKDSVL